MGSSEIPTPLLNIFSANSRNGQGFPNQVLGPPGSLRTFGHDSRNWRRFRHFPTLHGRRTASNGRRPLNGYRRFGALTFDDLLRNGMSHQRRTHDSSFRLSNSYAFIRYVICKWVLTNTCIWFDGIIAYFRQSRFWMESVG